MQLLIVLGCLVIALQLRGQDAPKASVEGTVVNEVTGEPLGRAAVALMSQRAGKPPASAMVQTQADGRFRFEGLEPGTYHLMARKNGYLNPGGGATFAPVTLTSGLGKSGLTMKLTPQGVISGRVFDEEGEPLQGAQVQVLHRRKLAGKLRWQPGMGTATNDRGEYRIPNVAGGEYAVSASYMDSMSQFGSGTPGRQVYATTYYPNGIELSSAQAVTVEKGGETGGIDVRLRKESAFNVRVRVEGVSAELLPQTNVVLMPRDAADFNGRRNTGHKQLEPGLYELSGVRAGSWVLQAQTFQQGGEPLMGATAIEVTTADLTDVIVRMGAGPQLTGTFVFEGTPPAPINWKNYHIGLAAAEGNLYSPVRPATVTEDGVFTVRYNLPGKYRIDVQGPRPGNTYLASIRIGSEEYFGKEIDLSGGAPGAVKIIYRGDAATVSGKLEGEIGGAAGALGMAVLVPVEAHLRRMEYMAAVPVRPDGSFTFGPVRPGEYLMCHMLGGYQTMHETGEPPKESMESAVRLKVDANGTHSVQVKAMRPPPAQ